MFRLYLDGEPVVDTKGQPVLYASRARAEFTADHWADFGAPPPVLQSSAELAARMERLGVLEGQRDRL